MNKLTGNEPVMPILNEPIANDGYGLTIRQKFAESAMQGLLSMMNREDFPPNYDNVEYCARLGVTAADILIKELNKEIIP